MKLQERKRIMDRLGVLVQEPMRSISREGGSIYLDFGELLEGRGVGTLCIACAMRLVRGNEILLAKRDMFMPTTANEDREWSSFEWNTAGNNRFDERVSELFPDEGFVVKAVSVTELGDLRIRFENGFVLEVFTDFSEEECWRFFEEDAQDMQLDLVVGSSGIVEEGGE